MYQGLERTVVNELLEKVSQLQMDLVCDVDDCFLH